VEHSPIRDTPLRLEVLVQEALEELQAKGPGLEWSNATWTAQLKGSLVALGRRLDFETFASGTQGEVAPSGGEWLFDVSWLQYDGPHLVKIPFVAESEWEPSLAAILDDFQKLLVARACLRLMVFSAPRGQPMSFCLEKLLEGVTLCNMVTPGDRFQFACWLEPEKRFEFATYVVPERAA
jgi:hypothetical protein